MIKNIISDVVSDVVSSVTGFEVLDLKPIAWYDAADDSTITESGGLVSIWADKSGNSRDLSQATVAAQPVYASNTLSFDGTDDYLWRAESFMYSETKPVTIFIVMESSAAIVRAIMAEGNSSTITQYFAYMEHGFNSAKEIRSTFQNNAGTLERKVVSADDYLESGVTNVYFYQDDLTNITTRKNGSDEVVTSYTRPSTPITLDQFSIGNLFRATSSSLHSDIEVNEIIIFDRILNDTEREFIQDYLAQKWSVTL